MKLDKWEYNNFYSAITDAMHYNLCIYHKDLDVDNESLDFFKYILENDYKKALSNEEVRKEIGTKFSSPVAMIKLKSPENDNIARDKIDPIPIEIIIKTKSMFCPDYVPDVSKKILCANNDNIKSAIFKANLELKKIGFDIELLCGISEDYKI